TERIVSAPAFLSSSPVLEMGVVGTGALAAPVIVSFEGVTQSSCSCTAFIRDTFTGASIDTITWDRFGTPLATQSGGVARFVSDTDHFRALSTKSNFDMRTRVVEATHSSVTVGGSSFMWFELHNGNGSFIEF